MQRIAWVFCLPTSANIQQISISGNQLIRDQTGKSPTYIEAFYPVGYHCARAFANLYQTIAVNHWIESLSSFYIRLYYKEHNTKMASPKTGIIDITIANHDTSLLGLISSSNTI